MTRNILALTCALALICSFSSSLLAQESHREHLEQLEMKYKELQDKYKAVEHLLSDFRGDDDAEKRESCCLQD